MTTIKLINTSSPHVITFFLLWQNPLRSAPFVNFKYPTQYSLYVYTMLHIRIVELTNFITECVPFNQHHPISPTAPHPWQPLFHSLLYEFNIFRFHV